jgi:transposase
MAKHYELTDEQCEIIRPVLPRPRRKGPGKPGRLVRDQRTIANALFWILLTGTPWRTAYHHFNRWRSSGAFDRASRRRRSAGTGTATSTGTSGAWTGPRCVPAAPRGRFRMRGLLESVWVTAVPRADPSTFGRSSPRADARPRQGVQAEADRAGRDALLETAQVLEGGDGPGREACAPGARR